MARVSKARDPTPRKEGRETRATVPTLRPATFVATWLTGDTPETRDPEDAGALFRGYTFGDTWNGWACPYLPKESADDLARITHAALALSEDRDGFNDLTYDAAKDAYIETPFGGPTEDDPGVEWQAETLPLADGTVAKLYPVGSHSWIWEERTPESGGGA